LLPLIRMRTMLATALLAALAACGGEPAPASPPPLPGLRTLTVQAPAVASGRAWDGVVEAVRQADLSAQTTGRVTVVNADVNDRVASGEVLLRMTAVEQQAGANTARAQLRAAEAAAAEAESNYRRFAALAGGQYVSKSQLDQARAARDSAVARATSAIARRGCRPSKQAITASPFSSAAI